VRASPFHLENSAGSAAFSAEKPRRAASQFHRWTAAAGSVEASERHRFNLALQDQCDRLRPVVASLLGDAGTALAAPDALRAAILGLQVVVADAERVSALRADGLLRGSIDPNESVALQGVLPSVSLSSTAREGPATRDEPSRARSAAREPLTAGAPV